jgi:hypothetical protein
MMKTFLTRPLWGEIVLTGAFSCLFAISALAQNASPAPTKGIGPAPANSKQHQILNGALSPQTRQTLQEAMNSARAADTARPAPPAK